MASSCLLKYDLIKLNASSHWFNVIVRHDLIKLNASSHGFKSGL